MPQLKQHYMSWCLDNLLRVIPRAIGVVMEEDVADLVNDGMVHIKCQARNYVYVAVGSTIDYVDCSLLAGPSAQPQHSPSSTKT